MCLFRHNILRAENPYIRAAPRLLQVASTYQESGGIKIHALPMYIKLLTRVVPLLQFMDHSRSIHGSTI
jgi:hypothetical protein